MALVVNKILFAIFCVDIYVIMYSAAQLLRLLILSTEKHLRKTLKDGLLRLQQGCCICQEVRGPDHPAQNVCPVVESKKRYGSTTFDGCIPYHTLCECNTLLYCPRTKMATDPQLEMKQIQQ